MSEVIDQVFKRLFALKDGPFLEDLGKRNLSGDQFSSFPTIEIVDTAEEFEGYFDDGTLEGLLLELRNELFDIAFSISKDVPHHLNDVATLMKPGLESEFGNYEIDGADNTAVGFGPSKFVATTNWIFMSYAQELFLNREYGNSIRVFDDFVRIFELGHFPCGWVTTPTHGKLIIF